MCPSAKVRLGLTGCVIKTFTRVFFIAPLFILGGAHYLSVFSAEQLQALALLFLKVNDRGAAVALVFFGFYALLTGYLIIRSTFLPRILGVLSVFGGLGWLSFLYQPLGYRLFPYVVAFAILGAASLILWLLVFGVNEQRCKEQASAAPEELIEKPDGSSSQCQALFFLLTFSCCGFCCNPRGVSARLRGCRQRYAQGRQNLLLIGRGLREFRHRRFLIDLVLQQAQAA